MPGLPVTAIVRDSARACISNYLTDKSVLADPNPLLGTFLLSPLALGNTCANEKKQNLDHFPYLQLGSFVAGYACDCCISNTTTLHLRCAWFLHKT